MEITKKDLTKLEERLINVVTELEENLSRMIAKGFEGVDERFKENAKEHCQIFEKFEKIDRRFENVEARLEHIEARLDTIERDLSEIKENMVYKHQYEDLVSRMELIESKIGIIS